MSSLLRTLKQTHPHALGVIDGSQAFTGPRCVQIDLTNACPNSCIGCWARSPYLGESAMPDDERKLRLPSSRVFQLLTELQELGTRELYFGGGGEPLSHPAFTAIIERAKNLGFAVVVHTNGLLMTEAIIDRLVQAQVEQIVVSLWAGDEEGYALVHPGLSRDHYPTLVRRLHYLGQARRRTKLKIYNVICNLNYRDLPTMLQCARSVGADEVEFTVLDSVPGKTDFLLLTLEQAAVVLKLLPDLEEAVQGNRTARPLVIVGLERLRRRLQSAGVAKGIYDAGAVGTNPCFIGWIFARVMCNGNVTPCLKADLFPLGNIHSDRFAAIWYGPRATYFRSVVAASKKKHRLFQMIGKDRRLQVGCVRTCDDLARSDAVREQLKTLSWRTVVIAKLLLCARRFHLMQGAR